MHEVKEKLPVLLEAPDTAIRALSGMGGMALACLELPAGTDLGPLLEGLPDDRCPCPHWGYVLEGKLTVSYRDGGDEKLEAGQVFYLPPGHTATVQEDAAIIELSPEKEYGEVISHVLAKAGG